MPGSPLDAVRKSVWGPTSTKLRQSPRYRAAALLAYRLAARSVLFGPPPRLFANSVPKSGTHLLTQLLGGVPRLWYAGMHADRSEIGVHPMTGDLLALPADIASFRRRMRHVHNGQYVTAHVDAAPEIIGVLDELSFQRILMIRDPRDIAVSLAFYYAKNPRLPAYELFANRYVTTHDRLQAVIDGVPAEGGRPPLQPLAVEIDRYAGWLDDPATLIVRFEDLVGERGGGTASAQRETVRDILRLCRREPDDASIEKLTRESFAEHSATFRRGAIGDWRNHFTDEQAAAYEASMPGLIARFGYA